MLWMSPNHVIVIKRVYPRGVWLKSEGVANALPRRTPRLHDYASTPHCVRPITLSTCAVHHIYHNLSQTSQTKETECIEKIVRIMLLKIHALLRALPGVLAFSPALCAVIVSFPALATVLIL